MATIPVSSMYEKKVAGNQVHPHVANARLPSFRPSASDDLVVCGVIGSTGDRPHACPCCNRPSMIEGRQTLDEPASHDHRDIPCAFDFDEEDSDDDESEDFLPGVLDSGVEYKFHRVLAEGWLSKKGTGKDWFGSRAWKPRWARLVLAKVDGYSVDVPLLLIYWFRSTPSPSTVILLDSTVVVPVDSHDHKDTCTEFRFDVVHVKDDEQSESVTRTFSAPKKGRDQWVYAINSALLNFEKDNAQARREAAALAELRPRTSACDSILDGERFQTVSDFSHVPLPPPTTSPRPPTSPKMPLPRPDQLLGESLLPRSDELLGESFLE